MAAKEKLIRDRVPQIIRAQGDEPIVRIADPCEYRELLRAKLVEEAHEVATADDAHVPEELADVLEVVDSRGCARPRPLNGAASPSESSGAAT